MVDSGISLLDVATRAGIVNFDIFDQEFSRKMLLNLSKHCVDWRLIGLYLELSEADIAAVNGDYQIVDEKRVGMLGRWKEKFAFKATYRVFIEALLASGRTEDAVDACKTIAKGLLQLKLDGYSYTIYNEKYFSDGHFSYIVRVIT